MKLTLLARLMLAAVLAATGVIGGGIDEGTGGVTEAFKLILSNTKVRAILVSVNTSVIGIRHGNLTVDFAIDNVRVETITNRAPFFVSQPQLPLHGEPREQRGKHRVLQDVGVITGVVAVEVAQHDGVILPAPITTSIPP